MKNLTIVLSSVIYLFSFSTYAVDIKLCNVVNLLKTVDRENINIKALVIDHKKTFAVHYVNNGIIDMHWVVSPEMHMQPNGKYEGQDHMGIAITNGETIYSLDSMPQGVSAIYKSCEPAPKYMIQELVDFDNAAKKKKQEQEKKEIEEKEKMKIDELKKEYEKKSFFDLNLKRAKEFNPIINDKIKSKEWIPVKVNIAIIPDKYDRSFVCDQVVWVATDEHKWAPVSYRKEGITLKQSAQGEWTATYKPDGKLADSTVSLLMPGAGYPTISNLIQGISALYISPDQNSPFYETYNCSQKYF